MIITSYGEFMARGHWSIDDIKVTNRSKKRSFETCEDFESGDFAATFFSPGLNGGQIVSDPQMVVRGKFLSLWERRPLQV